jgi:hypothetical protein
VLGLVNDLDARIAVDDRGPYHGPARPQGTGGSFPGSTRRLDGPPAERSHRFGSPGWRIQRRDREHGHAGVRGQRAIPKPPSGAPAVLRPIAGQEDSHPS